VQAALECRKSGRSIYSDVDHRWAGETRPIDREPLLGLIYVELSLCHVLECHDKVGFTVSPEYPARRSSHWDTILEQYQAWREKDDRFDPDTPAAEVRSDGQVIGLVPATAQSGDILCPIILLGSTVTVNAIIRWGRTVLTDDPNCEIVGQALLAARNTENDDQRWQYWSDMMARTRRLPLPSPSAHFAINFTPEDWLMAALPSLPLPHSTEPVMRTELSEEFELQRLRMPATLPPNSSYATYWASSEATKVTFDNDRDNMTKKPHQDLEEFP
jgi:hypothetical protein